MTLSDKLRRLRGQASASEPSPIAPDTISLGQSFADRVRRARAGQCERASARGPDEERLAEILGAERIAPGVLCLTRHISGRARHGHRMLGDGSAPKRLPWTKADPAVDRPPLPFLCLDTETSGLAGGTGTWAWLAGLLTPADGGWNLRQFLLARLDAEPAFLDALGTALANPSWLVTYNGRAFDAPLLTTRFRLAGQPNPLAEQFHLDLLAPVRRAFSRNWPDCRLLSAEERLLGVRRSDDLPGAAAPAAWLGWLRRGETEALAGVLRHNRDDLLALACLLPVLAEVYEEPQRFGADPHAVAAAHRANGAQDRARAILVASASELDARGLLELARLHGQGGDWAEALAIWERLATAGNPQARLALARYHEHRSRDLCRALDHAEALPAGDERERRLARLSKKLGVTQTRPGT